MTNPPQPVPRKKAKSTPVSLYEDQIQFAQKRGDVVGSVSKYFQILADYDREHNILPAALKKIAEKLEAEVANV